MAILYKCKGLTLNGDAVQATVASGPVVINDEGRVLLHRSPDTGKYQFTGGRLDDDFSPRANAKYRPAQDLGIEVVITPDIDPLIIVGEHKESGQHLVLMHYLASLADRGKQFRGDHDWFTLDQIRELDRKGDTSSPNVLLAVEHFLKVTQKK